MAAKIFQLKPGRFLKYGLLYPGKLLRKKALVFNLNMNVTNICNQNCPMCNAVITGDSKGVMITFDQYRELLSKLEPYNIASLTISGGEPSLVKEIPEILDYSAGKFPFGINVNSNLFAGEKIITPFASAALRNNIRIGTSFDGFGETADRLRGAKDVSARVLKNIELVTELRKELKSESTLNMHTVISDQNIDEVPEILELSQKYGWTQTLAPWNRFFYQDENDPDLPTLTYSDKLERVIALAASRKNIAVSRDFLLNIPGYVRGETDKYCPYLTGLFKSFKIFMEPNGDISLCSRQPIGNIHESSIEEILRSEEYKKDIQGYRACPKCWMACFVEILLATPGIYQKRIVNRY